MDFEILYRSGGQGRELKSSGRRSVALRCLCPPIKLTRLRVQDSWRAESMV